MWDVGCGMWDVGCEKLEVFVGRDFPTSKGSP